MSESERLQRLKEHRGDYDYSNDDLEKKDQELAERIRALLNHPKLDDYCMVDAYYYDFSEIPDELHEKLNLWCDCYLIYGITIEAELVSKWVTRSALDSGDPIVDGKVVSRPNQKTVSISLPPKIMQGFNPDLLSTPILDLKK